MMHDASPPTDAQTETFLRLLAQHERGLAVYIHSLVPHHADADDLLQEVRLTLWKHFASFEPGTHFGAWARKITLHQVLNYRRSTRRASQLELDFIEAVAAQIERRADSLNPRSEALQHCLQKLPEASRNLILWRYYHDCPIEEIASKSQRSMDAVYQCLSRIRTLLGECVQRSLHSPTA